MNATLYVLGWKLIELDIHDTRNVTCKQERKPVGHGVVKWFSGKWTKRMLA